VLGAVAGGVAVAAHNWSPFLGGAGGRGISPALGVTLAAAPEGTVVLGAGLGGGRVVRHTALAVFASLVALGPVLWWRRGWRGVVLWLSVAAPMVGKRLAGNAPWPGEGRRAVLVSRLLFDRDPAAGDGAGYADLVPARSA
jgi:hypothetical protein